MEELCDIVRDLGLAIILYLELLFIELAQSVDAPADVVVVQERARVVVGSELKQQDRVALVRLSCVHSVLLADLLLLLGLVVVVV